MKWNETYDLIEMYKGDYGDPIKFDVFDFEIGDTIIFIFENNKINPKIYNVNSSDFKFYFNLTKEESEKFNVGDYNFSIKQYRKGNFLNTILNGTLRVKETQTWN